MRFTLNYNTTTITLTAAAGPTLVTASINQLTGRTNFAANNPINGMAEVNTYTVSCSIVSAPVNSLGKAQMIACRLYVPAYTMNPTY